MLENNHQNEGRAFREFTEEEDDMSQSAAENPQNNTHQNINKSQKIAVISLAFFAVFVIILWFISFQRSIRSPFEYKGDTAVSPSQDQTNVANNQADRLKTQDTDGDGLTDWDELNVYQTSPYLEDSDSDGFNDKEEIDSGNDPNCPRGADCYSSGLTNGEKTIDSASSTPAQNTDLPAQSLGQTDQSAGASGDSGLTQAQIEAMASGEIDAQSLRKLLIEYGMDENILNQFSDEDLMKNWQETMQAQ